MYLFGTQSKLLVLCKYHQMSTQELDCTYTVLYTKLNFTIAKSEWHCICYLAIVKTTFSILEIWSITSVLETHKRRAYTCTKAMPCILFGIRMLMDGLYWPKLYPKNYFFEITCHIFNMLLNTIAHAVCGLGTFRYNNIKVYIPNMGHDSCQLECKLRDQYQSLYRYNTTLSDSWTKWYNVYQTKKICSEFLSPSSSAELACWLMLEFLLIRTYQHIRK